MATKVARRHKWRMRDLPGRKGITLLVGVGSIAGAMKYLREGEIGISSAGDDGALDVYRQRNGVLRGRFHRYMVTQNDETFKSLKEVRAWLTIWWPKMGY